MASFLLGDEYASCSSSSDEEASPVSKPLASPSPPVAAAPTSHLLPSAADLFASDTSSVLTTNRSVVLTSNPHKRKSDQVARPATKVVKKETGEGARKLKTAPFAPPQLRRPNISTEDRSSWNTDKTLALQKKAKEQDK